MTGESAKDPHAADVALARACAQGDARAIARFEAAFAGDIEAALRSMRLADHVIQDVKQELRRKFFVGSSDSPPKIADYSGRADLKSWVRTATVRTALSLLRKGKEVPVEDEIMHQVPSAADDPELDHFKQR